MWAQLHKECLNIINAVLLELKALLLTLRKVHNLSRASLVSLSGFTFKEQQSRSSLGSALLHITHTWFRLLAPIVMTLYSFSQLRVRHFSTDRIKTRCNIVICSRGNLSTGVVSGEKKKTERWLSPRKWTGRGRPRGKKKRAEKGKTTRREG